LVRDPGGQARASLGQERLWALSSLAGAGPAYHIALAVRLLGEVRRSALVAALSTLSDRHGSLRTVFRPGRDGLVREVRPPGEGGREIAVTPMASLAEAEAAARAAAAAPFDLSTGPAWRARLYPAGPARAVLLLAGHHLVCDGWSLGILLRELASLYNGLVAGRPVELAPLTLGYGDYAARQRRRLDGAAAAESLRYWREQLRDAPPLELLADHPRPAVASLRGGVVREPVPGGALAGVPAMAREQGVTPYMIGLAGFAAVLHRYTGQLDLCVGTAVADRTAPGTESLVGFLVNNLVFRFDLSGRPSFRELLGRTRAVVLEALAHRDAPFERLVEELVAERDLSRNPLFQVVFADEHSPLAGVELTGLAVEELPLELGVSKFDLTVTLATGSAGWELAGHYRADLFEPATVRRLLRNYRWLLAVAIRDPATRIGDLPAPHPCEREAVLRTWNQTAVPLPEATTVDDLIAEQARRRPAAPAVRGPAASLSYRQLLARADLLAARLRSLRVGPGVPVGLLLPRCVEAVVGLVGILRAGGAYLPLDPAHPEPRNRGILDHAGAAVVVTAAAYRDRVAGRSAVCLDPGGLDLAGPYPAGPSPAGPDRPGPDHAGGRGPDELAYIIYTSGSTGQPKGVTVGHRALLRFVHQQTYGTLSPDQTRLQLSPYTFDASLIEVWGTLVSGGCVAVPDHRLDLLGQVSQGVEQLGVDTALFVSPQLHLLVERRPELVRRLREVQVGGDVLSVRPGRRAAELLGGRPLIHVYGPTECTLFATATRILPDQPAGATFPIGRPIANTRTYVLDRHLQPVPIGAPGQLYLAGPGLAWGYLARPGLTADRFRPDPFAGSPGERMYATGDHARWLADGQLEFLGRLDTQVKLRGYRIELGEVEHAISEQPGVRDAVVLLREDLPGGPALVGYVVGGPEVTRDSVIERLRQRLPGYLVPAEIVRVDRIPLTVNGKADRGRLPAPPARRAAGASPADRVESAVLALWRQVLGTDQPIPVDVKFFDAGGDSVGLVRLFDDVSRRFPESDLTIVELFTYNTIRELARRLRGGAGS
jgi:aspartate racemase